MRLSVMQMPRRSLDLPRIIVIALGGDRVGGDTTQHCPGRALAWPHCRRAILARMDGWHGLHYRVGQQVRGQCPRRRAGATGTPCARQFRGSLPGCGMVAKPLHGNPRHGAAPDGDDVGPGRLAQNGGAAWLNGSASYRIPGPYVLPTQSGQLIPPRRATWWLRSEKATRKSTSCRVSSWSLYGTAKRRMSLAAIRWPYRHSTNSGGSASTWRCATECL